MGAREYTPRMGTKALDPNRSAEFRAQTPLQLLCMDKSAEAKGAQSVL